MNAARLILLLAARGALTRLNPADRNANVALSNSNLTATGTSGIDTGVRATISRSSKKWYFETTITTRDVGGQGNDVGIADAVAPLTLVGAGSASWGYHCQGKYVLGGVFEAPGTRPTYTTGDIISTAADLDNHKIWWAKNGVWQNGDPSTPTGGTTITSGALFPMLSVSNGDVSTVNFGALPFSYALPTAFAPWG